MKHFLSYLTLGGIAAFIAALAFDFHALAFFAFAASGLIALVATADYAPLGCYGCPRRVAAGKTERSPLAA